MRQMSALLKGWAASATKMLDQIAVMRQLNQ
jgi:hypothetical protein